MMDDKAINALAREMKKPILVEQQFFKKPFQTDPEKPEGNLVSVPLLAIPNDYKMENLKPYLDAFRDTPERRKGDVRLDTAQSFIDFVNRNKGPNTALFATNGNADGQITAVFNYHPAGPDQEVAGWGDFKAKYSFPASEPFKVWAAASGRSMAMKDFAAFLEDRIPDLGVETDDYTCKFDLRGLDPTYAEPSQVLALSAGITVNMKKKYGQHQRLATGEHKIEFSEEHDDATTKKGYTITVPQFFLLDIPVFEGGPRSLIPVRLRYQVGSDNAIAWRFDVWNVVQIFAEAFRGEVAKITSQTTLPQFFGA